MEHTRPDLVESVEDREEGVSVGWVWASWRRAWKAGGIGGRVERRFWIWSEVGQVGWLSTEGPDGEGVGGAAGDGSLGWGHIRTEDGQGTRDKGGKQVIYLFGDDEMKSV